MSSLGLIVCELVLSTADLKSELEQKNIWINENIQPEMDNLDEQPAQTAVLKGTVESVTLGKKSKFLTQLCRIFYEVAQHEYKNTAFKTHVGRKLLSSAPWPRNDKKIDMSCSLLSQIKKYIRTNQVLQRK